MALKRIIIGTPSFSMARQKGWAFVDKTRYLALLENECGTPAPVFLRPRRFGKTFLAEMLYCYYDKSLAGEFEQNFKGTWIYSHKTREAGSFCCLCLDFSAVSSDPGEAGQSMADELACAMRDFACRYPDLGLPCEQLDEYSSACPADLMEAFAKHFMSSARGGERLFIIIDECDFLANGILQGIGGEPSHGPGQYGFARDFYACLQRFHGQGAGNPISRLFITGVTDVSLEPLFQGLECARDISSDRKFSAMAGFTHGELSRLADETLDSSAMPKLEKNGLMAAMEEHYDGYSFSDDAQERVFNPNMCLAFLYSVARRGALPKKAPGNGGDPAARLSALLNLADPKARGCICDALARYGQIAAPGALEARPFRGGALGLDEAVRLLLRMGYLTFGGCGNARFRLANRLSSDAFFACLGAKAGQAPTALQG